MKSNYPQWYSTPHPQTCLQIGFICDKIVGTANIPISMQHRNWSCPPVCLFIVKQANLRFPGTGDCGPKRKKSVENNVKYNVNILILNACYLHIYFLPNFYCRKRFYLKLVEIWWIKRIDRHALVPLHRIHKV